MSRPMKDSGIEWIGEIPQEWGVIKFKYLFNIIGGNGFPETLQGKTEGEYPFCKVSDINGSSAFVSSANNYVSEKTVSEYKFNIIPSNSILMAKIGAALRKNHRKINVVPCCIDNNTQALVSKRADNIKYLYYLSQIINMEWFDNNSTVPSINNGKLLLFFVPNVKNDEQKRIADFLDRKSAEIDTVIKKTEESIEEYKKLKQSIITEAVTKGIRPGRKMKPSGIEWIGDIPEEWERRKLKSFTSVISKGATPTDMSLVNDNKYTVAFVKGESIVNGLVSYEKCNYITEEADAKLSRSRLQKDDILFVIAGSIGKCGIVKELIMPTNINQAIAFVRLYKEYQHLNRYIRYYFESNYSVTYYSLNTVRSALPNLSMEDLSNMYVSLPKDKKEIDEIVDFLDRKSTEIDKLIEAKQKIVEEMQTYKKSVIYEYVTGKKEVS